MSKVEDHLKYSDITLIVSFNCSSLIDIYLNFQIWDINISSYFENLGSRFLVYNMDELISC